MNTSTDTKLEFSTNQIQIPWAEMVALRKAGKLSLGINKDAAAIMSTQGISPRTTANLAFHVYSWVSVGVVGAALYFSFTDAWWWLPIGVVVARVIWKANKSAHADNFLDAAVWDESFYEKGRSLGVWRYRVSAADSIDIILSDT